MVAACPESVIHDVISSYVQGICEGDADAVCSLFTEDATVEDPAGTPVRRGAGAIREFYLYAVSARPHLTIMAAPVVVGAFSATPMKARLELDGKALEIDFISVMSFSSEGRIRMMTAYFDPSAISS